MFIRAYLRASTKEQDAKRAKSELIAFANDHGHKIAAFYVENESGATLVRTKLIGIRSKECYQKKSYLSYQKSCRPHIWRFNLKAALNL